MILNQILPDVQPSAAVVEITGLAYDNRAVVPGTLFFCVPGFTRDGHDFAPDAIARGAVALVVERPLEPGRPGDPGAERPGGDGAGGGGVLRRPDRRASQTVGVTGTNGKTTTAFLVHALLEAGQTPDRAARARSRA